MSVPFDSIHSHSSRNEVMATCAFLSIHPYCLSDCNKKEPHAVTVRTTKETTHGYETDSNNEKGSRRWYVGTTSSRSHNLTKLMCCYTYFPPVSIFALSQVVLYFGVKWVLSGLDPFKKKKEEAKAKSSRVLGKLGVNRNSLEELQSSSCSSTFTDQRFKINRT